MNCKIHDIGVASQIGRYSDALEAAPNLRWRHTSGTPGLLKDKTLPKDIMGQSELAWEDIMRLLRDARTKYLGDARPASLLLVVHQLVWPEILIEVEVIAARA